MSALGQKQTFVSVFDPFRGQWFVSSVHCQSKILNTIGGHGIPWINPEKSREINGSEIRSRCAGKVFNVTLTMPIFCIPRHYCAASDQSPGFSVTRPRQFRNEAMEQWRDAAAAA